MRFIRLRLVFPLFLGVFVLSGCSSLFADRLVLKKATYEELSGWGEDRYEEALQAFSKSCDNFEKRPPTSYLNPKTKIGERFANWRYICSKDLDYLHSNAAQSYFEKNFDVYQVTNRGNGKAFFTGYYEIALQGSLYPDERYRYPIYRKPGSLDAKRPYYTRGEIDQGALVGKGLELLWVDDPVRLFFLHIQGSGVVELEDGSKIRVGYHAKNNRPYTSIGRYFIDNDLIAEDDMSAEALMEWLYDNPDERDAVLAQNASYVFFRRLDTEGPIGSQGVVLTKERSLAIDKNHLPLGVPVWVEVELNETSYFPSRNFNKLMVTQDTGGAIKGPARGDIFFGNGVFAEQYASYTQNHGRYYILLPKKERTVW